MGCVYLILCGNVRYIGSTKNVFNRIGGHLYVLSKGKHHSKKLQEAYNANNPFKFEIIEYNIPLRDLRKREQYWINKKNPNGNAMRAYSLDNPKVPMGISIRKSYLDWIKERNFPVGNFLDEIFNGNLDSKYGTVCKYKNTSCALCKKNVGNNKYCFVKESCAAPIVYIKGGNVVLCLEKDRNGIRIGDFLEDYISKVLHYEYLI